LKVNYQRMLERALDLISSAGTPPKLLLHSCCGPCSSYVLEYLTKYFTITIIYYNPNIYPESEFEKRAAVQRSLLTDMRFSNPVDLVVCDYEPAPFNEAVRGLENEPEGGKRCGKCFELRLKETARLAKDLNYDFFTTTLSVSPHKNAQALNELGEKLAEEYGVPYLFSDFKKRDGYKRSIELSELYGLYRQDYCGCLYSLNSKKTTSSAISSSSAGSG
jgi:predicted adenine nucleotide alpha hydrolase (AANH) superfamily ATPase